MNVSKAERVSPELVEAEYEANGGNIRATALALGIERSTVRSKLKLLGKNKKPLSAGTEEGTKTNKLKLPLKGKVARYILTSAQNNTYVHESAWENLLALADHY